MSLNALLGTNPATRYKSIGYVKKKTAKWGKVFIVLEIIQIVMAMLVTSSRYSALGAKMILVLPLTLIAAYLIGKAYGWGWMWIKAHMGITASDVASASAKTAVEMALTAGIFGGRSIIWSLLIILFFIAIGFYVGLVSFIRYEIEYIHLRKALHSVRR